MERLDGNSKVVGPLRSPPYAVYKVQHPMVGLGQWAEAQGHLGSYSRLRHLVSVVRKKPDKVRKEDPQPSKFCFVDENQDRNLGEGNDGILWLCTKCYT